MDNFADYIKKIILNYIPGDLTALSDIKKNLISINSGLTNENLKEFISKIASIFNDAVKNNKEAEFLNILNNFIDDIFNNNINDFNGASTVEKTNYYLNIIFESGIISLYDDNYFANLIEDRNMIVKYIDEADEHLTNAQSALIDLEKDPYDEENLNNVFRCFHTIKSSSAFLGFNNIQEISHSLEDLFVLIRDRQVIINTEIINFIFNGIQLLRNLFDIIEKCNYKKDQIIECYRMINIYNYLNFLRNAIKEYKSKKIGEILQDQGKIDRLNVDDILKKQELEKKKFGEIAIDEKLISNEDLSDALKKQTLRIKKSAFVKVSHEKLNLLIDFVGELVVTQSIFKDDMKKSDSREMNIEKSVNLLETITTNIKNLVLSMGMVPLADLFNKLRVVARNAATETGKIIDIDFYGEDIELDKNVIDLIYDPFVHLLRNSIDHGIEKPDDRIGKSKSRIGKITVSAVHKQSVIELTILDDGKGIDAAEILKKAKSMNLIENEDISLYRSEDIYNLMFVPGFTTKEKTTEMSGRGVGLDVVKQNVESVRGKVEVVSETGKFTKFIVKLPITLAIIDGFVTKVRKNRYIFLFDLIDEIIIPDRSQIKIMENNELFLFNKNIYIPVIHSARILNEDASDFDLFNSIIIVIRHENKNYGIAVDSILGKQEIVIKSLNELSNRIDLFSGGTIFGDGEIGFVLDIDKFIAKSKLMI